MSKIVVRVENLSKVYKIGRIQNRHDTLRDQITHGIRNLFRGDRIRAKESMFWALDDISFDVNQGEVIGIIGRNGAGKSTLLKILSRITAPTKGSAKIYGRVSSLLEVGTGFHAELTGRENIFLNGAILGMKHAEVSRKFDEIVSFAEIENFVDTPVKRYSSGMYVRLAFAVAAHLEPEVLIVDEVLAVGDIAFQTKCLGKMSEVAGYGRTVLFVSHNMAAVQHLCSKALLLDGGKTSFWGKTSDAIDHYVREVAGFSSTYRSHIVDLVNTDKRRKAFAPILTRMEFYTERDEPANACVKMGAPLKVKIFFRTEKPIPAVDVTLGFRDNLGQWVLLVSSIYQKTPPVADRAGEYTFVCEIPSLTLLPGDYPIAVSIDTNAINIDRVDDATRFTVLQCDYLGGGRLPSLGFFAVKSHWREETVMPAKVNA